MGKGNGEGFKVLPLARLIPTQFYFGIMRLRFSDMDYGCGWIYGDPLGGGRGFGRMHDYWRGDGKGGGCGEYVES